MSAKKIVCFCWRSALLCGLALADTVVGEGGEQLGALRPRPRL